jgi:DNA-binding CsgD family transcriptional regulator
MRGKKISAEQEKQIVSLYADGKGSVVIGRQLGLSYATVLRTLRRKKRKLRHKGGSGGHRTPLTEEQKNEIVRLYEQLTIEEIGEKTSISSNAVYNVLHQRDIRMRPANCRLGIRRK